MSFSNFLASSAAASASFCFSFSCSSLFFWSSPWEWRIDDYKKGLIVSLPSRYFLSTILQLLVIFSVPDIFFLFMTEEFCMIKNKVSSKPHDKVSYANICIYTFRARVVMGHALAKASKNCPCASYSLAILSPIATWKNNVGYVISHDSTQLPFVSINLTLDYEESLWERSFREQVYHMIYHTSDKRYKIANWCEPWKKEASVSFQSWKFSYNLSAREHDHRTLPSSKK